MRIIRVCLWLQTSFLLLIPNTCIIAQSIEVEITGFRSTKGQLVLEVYRDSESFQKEVPYKRPVYNKKDIKNGVLEVKLNLEKGIYGLALIDDENSNSEMDFKLIGLPKEGFGFSNFYLTGLKKPSFDDIKFIVKKENDKPINMKIKYL